MKMLRVFFVPLLAFLFTSFQAVAADSEGPSLWKIEDEDTTLYLFGTIHILNSEVQWITPEFQNAFVEADAIVLETSPDQEDPAIIDPLLQKYGLLPPGETLQSKVSSETYADLGMALGKMGAPGNAMDNMQPWLAGIILAVQGAAQYGFLPQYGVEEILTQSAIEARKNIYGLEMAADVLSQLGNLSDQDQEIFLKSTLSDLDNLQQYFADLRDAWLAGDQTVLGEQLIAELEAYPAIADALLYQRNHAWIKVISNLMDGPGTYLVAAGAGHFIGQQNVLLLLEEEGYTIIQVR